MDNMNDISAKRKQLAADYGNKLREKQKELQNSLGDDRFSLFGYYYNVTNTKIYAELHEVMRSRSLSEHIKKNMRWLSEVFSEEKLNALVYYAEMLPEYPYSESYMRRSLRSKDATVYLDRFVSALRGLRTFTIDEPLADILNRRIPEDAQAYLDETHWSGAGYEPMQIAYALDSGNGEVAEAVRRILTEENSSNMMRNELIKGILMSKNAEFHDLLCKLLLAARLQEGLRQAICENADCGTKEGFFAILHTIADNGLIRFSSVKRAVGVWLGLLTEEVRDLERVSAKSLEVMIDCLEDPEKREEYIASEDAMKIYIALWSLGFESVEASAQRIEGLIKNGTRHQLLVAGYYVMNLDQVRLSNSIAKRVLRSHSDKEDVLAVWLFSYMKNSEWVLADAYRNKRTLDYRVFYDDRAEIDAQYSTLRSIYSGFSGKEKVFSPCVFPWFEARLKRSTLAEKLCAAAAFSGDRDKIDFCAQIIKECSSDHRARYFTALLSAPETEIQRSALIEGLADKESSTRMSAREIIKNISLRDDEYEKIEGFLRFKGADIRKSAIELIMRQSEKPLVCSISRLLENEKEEIRLGGLDILTLLRADGTRRKIYESFISKLREMGERENIPSKEKILLESLIPKQAAKKEALFTEEDRYLPQKFDEKFISDCIDSYMQLFPDSALAEQYKGKKTGFFKKLVASTPAGAVCKTAAEAASDLKSLSDHIHEHREYECTLPNGEKALLGQRNFYFYCDPDSENELSHLWAEWVTKNGITPSRILRALVLLHAYTGDTDGFPASCRATVCDVFGAGFDRGLALPYALHVLYVLRALSSRIPSEKFREIGAAFAAWFIRCVSEDDAAFAVKSRIPGFAPCEHISILAHGQLNLVYMWLYRGVSQNHSSFFPLMVASSEKSIRAFAKAVEKTEAKDAKNANYYQTVVQRDSRVLRIPYGSFNYGASDLAGNSHYIIAAYKGVITRRQLLEFLMRPDNINGAARLISSVKVWMHERDRLVSSRNIYHSNQCLSEVRSFLGIKKGDPSEAQLELLGFVEELYDVIIPEMLDSELKRGDSVSEYTGGIRGIRRIYGSEYFARILDALGGDTLERSTWSSATDRRSSLSHLLSVCVPDDGDGADSLGRALEGKKVSQKRLIEGALYSSEWIDTVGKYLGIEGFESVCYYFIAHMNEQFDDKRKAVIARYTPLDAEELHLGAFDVDWFRSAHGAVGEKTFDMIYDAAKYISDGAKHARARKYADAALGKVTPENVAAAVSDKRNKDLLMSYALIPLRGEDDLCERYAYIQKFRKESKKFGSQRVQSEGKACEIALKNLATNAGYSDTVRLTLRMETKMVDDNRELFKEQIIDGVSLKLEIDDAGKARIVVKKDEKELKSIPAKLKKNESVIRLGAFAKTLTEQYRRTRLMLEEAMENSTEFGFSELCALSEHPVVYPMLKNLVLCADVRFGFITGTGLTDAQGDIFKLTPETRLRVAHPYDMFSAGVWRDYQKYLFDNTVSQPFRQVFRELYIKTDEERGMLHSLRYAGNQIMPAKTAACLKSRGWVADIESGLQKVYYKENIVAQIFALADWFSPSDIEAPTLEWVCFSQRLSGDELKIDEVPDIIFSEVMRDVDLAVSVAHAGGVDPETSHSTIEMRAALLSFILPMFRITNARTEGSHALIEGKLADYSVHLGSGVVHQLGGAMIPVLPVHSQHRGRIFLPFADDDPKTAEIVSKILLFADDSKIKDPTILSSITPSK